MLVSDSRQDTSIAYKRLFLSNIYTKCNAKVTEILRERVRDWKGGRGGKIKHRKEEKSKEKSVILKNITTFYQFLKNTKLQSIKDRLNQFIRDELTRRNQE